MRKNNILLSTGYLTDRFTTMLPVGDKVKINHIIHMSNTANAGETKNMLPMIVLQILHLYTA